MHRSDPPGRETRIPLLWHREMWENTQQLAVLWLGSPSLALLRIIRSPETFQNFLFPLFAYHHDLTTGDRCLACLWLIPSVGLWTLTRGPSASLRHFDFPFYHFQQISDTEWQVSFLWLLPRLSLGRYHKRTEVTTHFLFPLYHLERRNLPAIFGSLARFRETPMTYTLSLVWLTPSFSLVKLHSEVDLREFSIFPIVHSI